MTDCRVCSYLDRLETMGPDHTLAARIVKERAKHNQDKHPQPPQKQAGDD